MKPAEELVRDKFDWLCDSLPVEHYEWLIVEIGSLIHQDRLAVRKKCAEVARSKMIRGDYKDCPAGWMNNAYTIFAKAIEEMEL